MGTTGKGKCKIEHCITKVTEVTWKGMNEGTMVVGTVRIYLSCPHKVFMAMPHRHGTK